ncbi:MAG: MBOAT family protein [Xanthomonadaceae bacterium]|nr:MBOAT family protein [Xanthomonadaceae bacterium]
MAFDSLTFAGFIVVLFSLVAMTRGWRARKLELLAASYLFYAAWNPVFIILLLGSTVIDWHAARRLHASQEASSRRLWLLVSLVVNLGLLGWFKYADFMIANFNAALAGLGFGAAFRAPALDLVLPIGISFYTFQTLSYTIDVYRRRIEPGTRFSDYALYVSFFPQLVAGPIVRYSEFIGQLNEPQRIRASDVEHGAAWIIGGLFLKTVLADSLFAPVVDAGFASPGLLSGVSVWAALVSFSGQIYCDFAGYSLCAIGAARLFGFRLPINFHLPYASIGFSDFWQRWHISLSSWIRDYLYIPLGGNRHGVTQTMRNLMLAMGLGGLWHGAAWTFVLWGLLHGLFLVVEHGIIRLWVSLRLPRGPLLGLLAGALTFAAVSLSWVLFRAESLPQAVAFYQALSRFDSSSAPTTLASLALLAMALLLAWHALLRKRLLSELYPRIPYMLRGLIVGVLLAAVLLSPGDDRAFIYFQF